MSFVRVKNINGGEYAYLVDNTWTERGARQKVNKYLGKVFRFEKGKSESLAKFLKIEDVRNYIQANDFKKIAADLIRRELHNHDVKTTDLVVDFQSFMVKNIKGKGIVVAMNNGFLCDYSLKKLLDYKAEQDYSGYLLADLITAAGIMPEQDLFIELYGKFKAKHEAAAAKKFEFYY